MTHKIPVANWPTALAKAVEDATDGDTVEVHTAAMKQLAEQLQGRTCPDKALQFEIVPPEGAGELLAMLEDAGRTWQRGSD